jgi:DhnA family fructose-bisphosphate aldolase class Ia
MNSLDYRLKEFLPDQSRRAVLLDTSAGLSLGALPGVLPEIPCMDGLVCSPGQLRRFGNRTRADAALLVRVDWTNTLRGSAFPLPPAMATRLTILDAQDALELGASGMVLSMLLGYEEAVDMACVKAAVQLALDGKDLGLPLLVEVCPSGPRVSLPDKAVEMGASFALESGADVVIVPYPGPDSLKTISAMLSVPWLLKPTTAERSISEWEAAFGFGAAGLWLDHTWLDHTWLEPAMPLKELTDLVHKIPERVS